MLLKNTTLIALSLCALVGATTAAQAVNIEFNNIGGSNLDPYSGHTEVGFDVAPVQGQWFKAQAFGNPVPAIFAGPIDSPSISEFSVKRNGGGLFSFKSVDLTSNSLGGTAYVITGKQGASTMFTLTGSINSVNTFETIVSGTGANIDMLSVLLRPPTGVSSMNADNIWVEAVPEPGALLTLGLGAVALLRRRK